MSSILKAGQIVYASKQTAQKNKKLFTETVKPVVWKFIPLLNTARVRPSACNTFKYL